MAGTFHEVHGCQLDIMEAQHELYRLSGLILHAEGKRKEEIVHIFVPVGYLDVPEHDRATIALLKRVIFFLHHFRE